MENERINRHSAFFDEVCENDFAEWNKEMKVIETYPKWEVLANAIGRVKRWENLQERTNLPIAV